MDLTVFLIGTGLFGAGFFLLLFLLLTKKRLIVPFILMGIGVAICFIGLVLSSPLTEEEQASTEARHTLSR
ncbi:hypothetical protein SAMN05192534_101567 [Alteribacillus persepolensis]|uniref:Uncharacterized protein n=1 Tax=Alteribacillus persepolensis TaxID=568899 RepID=A0A1G7ZIV2_9BACI|nr:hypothetical protein [Alteribacillus persepolensis]SDH08711.1 hypothetical protein SAMN05192534_101567 [Alteribacillus persepolensis]